MNPETRIVQNIIRWIKASGGAAFHVHGNSVQEGGQPDILGFIPGAVLALEVKTNTGTAAPIQLYRLKIYQDSGLYCAGVVRSVQETQALVEAYHTVTENGQPDYTEYPLKQWYIEDWKNIDK